MSAQRLALAAFVALAVACGPATADGGKFPPAPPPISSASCGVAADNLALLRCPGLTDYPYRTACVHYASVGVSMAAECVASARTCKEALQCR